MCHLRRLKSPDLLTPTIAEAINLTFREHVELKAQLLDHLHSKEMLLVLDNFEHLLTSLEGELKGGADLVLNILRDAPQIVILVTSREQLNFQAESVLTLQGLSFPQDDQDPTRCGLWRDTSIC